MAALNARAPRLCLWLTLLLGLAYALVYPPFTPNQELAQFAEARDLANGRLAPVAGPHGAVRVLPAARADGLDTYAALSSNGEARLDHALWWADLGAASTTEVRVATAPDSRSPVPLLAHVPALWLGNALGLSTLAQLYVARVFGLVSYALLAALAVAWSAPLRPLFLTLALTPAALSDAASVTGASLPYALSLLLAAALVRSALPSHPPADSARSVLLPTLVGAVRPALWWLALAGAAWEGTRRTPRRLARALAPALLSGALVVLLWLADPRPWLPPPYSLATHLTWIVTHPLAALKLLGLTLFRRGDEALIQLVASDGLLAQQLRLSGVAITLLFGQLLVLLSCGALHGLVPRQEAARLARACAFTALLAGVASCVSLGLREVPLGAPILELFDGAAFRPLLPWFALALAFGVRPVATRWLVRRPLMHVVLPIALLHAYALFALFGRFHASTDLPFPS